MKHNRTLYYLLVALLTLGVMSCKETKEDSDTTVIYSTSPSSTLVTRFALKPNVKILANLDSVKFTIDQDKGLIYNPDSLPMGTKVSKMLVTVSFGSTIGAAEFVVKGEKQDTTIRYSDTSTDSIDFTKNVVLNVTSADGTNKKSYRIMVNVHQENPDTLVFPITARRNLPAAGDDNYAVGMAKLGDLFYTVVNNSNGRYVGTASTPVGPWTTEKVTLPFTPVESTLTATADALYMLDDAGNLFTSTDAKSWTSTGQVWKSMLGGYVDRVLGISQVDGALCFDEYPRRASYAPKAVPANFPVSGSSQLIMTANEWTINNMALLVGGRLASGEVTGAAWGYDGNVWGEVSYDKASTRLPALEGASLFSYYTYIVAKDFSVTKKVAWLVMGGRLSNGKYNRSTFISYNQGINWSLAPTSLSLPEFIPSGYHTLAFVCNETISVNKAPARVSKPINDWDCHYLYLVGGYDVNDKLMNNVWKGTIRRMEYKPVY
ncbi:MAG: hypothetical protein KBT09_05810 [Bacteroidales bacterium]|nr:hypothetical protein [Candidatus Sodaliphilus fimicaballi]